MTDGAAGFFTLDCVPSHDYSILTFSGVSEELSAECPTARLHEIVRHFFRYGVGYGYGVDAGAWSSVWTGCVTSIPLLRG